MYFSLSRQSQTFFLRKAWCNIITYSDSIDFGWDLKTELHLSCMRHEAHGQSCYWKIVYFEKSIVILLLTISSKIKVYQLNVRFHVMDKIIKTLSCMIWFFLGPTYMKCISSLLISVCLSLTICLSLLILTILNCCSAFQNCGTNESCVCSFPPS